MDKIKKEALVEQFRAYLEKSADKREEVPEKLSLHSFYSELVALKSELKIESRLVKQGLEHFQETAVLIREGNQKLDSLLEKKNEDNGNEDPFMQPMVQGLIDLYDRVQASLQTVSGNKQKRAWYQWWKGNDEEILQSVGKGQEITLERIVELLAQCDVVPMVVAACKFDPHTMRAVGTDLDPSVEDGIVSKESRTGFTQGGRVIRLADVRVSRYDKGD